MWFLSSIIIKSTNWKPHIICHLQIPALADSKVFEEKFNTTQRRNVKSKMHPILKCDFKNIWAPIWMIEIHSKLFEISQPDEWKLFYEIFNHSWLCKSFCSCFFAVTLNGVTRILRSENVSVQFLYDWFSFMFFYLTFNRLLKGLFLGLHEYISWILNLLFN